MGTPDSIGRIVVTIFIIWPLAVLGALIVSAVRHFKAGEKKQGIYAAIAAAVWLALIVTVYLIWHGLKE